ncbi:MAG: hypothetical protein DMF72_20600 [Acidobacteria bacterium]|nr:MAG: hypothetical protein DMF72_20600 [Acidobacteriota bacterium]
MPADLTEKEFSQHLNTKFKTKIDDQPIDLELIEVKSYFPQENEQAGMERFSVFFNGPSTYLPQRVYSFEHDAMGQFDLFLVPISQNGTSFRYEAVFNYFKK